LDNRPISGVFFMAKYNEQFKLKVAEEAAQDHILD
jgi:hypothetical protein